MWVAATHSAVVATVALSRAVLRRLVALIGCLAMLVFAACDTGPRTIVSLDLSELRMRAAQEATRIDVLTLEVLGAGVPSPFVVPIDLSDPVFTVEVESGPGRQFIVEARSTESGQGVPTYWGGAVVDLPPGGEVQVSIPIYPAGGVTGTVVNVADDVVPLGLSVRFANANPRIPAFGLLEIPLAQGAFSGPLPVGEYTVTIDFGGFAGLLDLVEAQQLVIEQGQTSASVQLEIAPVVSCTDADEDGVCQGFDCDDSAATGASCSSTCNTYYLDGDGDGAAGNQRTVQACVLPTGAFDAVTDCDDTSALCASDCTTDADSDSVPDCRDTCIDPDSDGYGVAPSHIVAALGDGSANQSSSTGGFCAGPDCDQTNAAIYPGAQELAGDGVDQDCDNQELCFVDGDGDGFGHMSDTRPSASLACDASGEAPNNIDCDDTMMGIGGPDVDGDGRSECGGDCDDNDAMVYGSVTSDHPAAAEICDGKDNNCNGVVDDTLLDSDGNPGADVDGDGYKNCEDNCPHVPNAGTNTAEIPARVSFEWQVAPYRIGATEAATACVAAEYNFFLNGQPLNSSPVLVQPSDGECNGCMATPAIAPSVRNRSLNLPANLWRTDGNNKLTFSRSNTTEEHLLWLGAVLDFPGAPDQSVCLFASEASSGCFTPRTCDGLTCAQTQGIGLSAEAYVPKATQPDGDGDGVGTACDCDDTNPHIPQAAEDCGFDSGVQATVDKDCDGSLPWDATTNPIDESLRDTDCIQSCMFTDNHHDLDRDGYYTAGVGEDCVVPANKMDCADGPVGTDAEAPYIHPGAWEGYRTSSASGPVINLCTDGRDNDCDTLTDSADPDCAGTGCPNFKHIGGVQVNTSLDTVVGTIDPCRGTGATTPPGGSACPASFYEAFFFSVDFFDPNQEGDFLTICNTTEGKTGQGTPPPGYLSIVLDPASSCDELCLTPSPTSALKPNSCAHVPLSSFNITGTQKRVYLTWRLEGPGLCQTFTPATPPLDNPPFSFSIAFKDGDPNQAPLGCVDVIGN